MIIEEDMKTKKTLEKYKNYFNDELLNLINSPCKCVVTELSPQYLEKMDEKEFFEWKNSERGHSLGFGLNECERCSILSVIGFLLSDTQVQTSMKQNIECLMTDRNDLKIFRSFKKYHENKKRKK
jgi:hypothetical protein